MKPGLFDLEIIGAIGWFDYAAVPYAWWDPLVGSYVGNGINNAGGGHAATLRIGMALGM